MFGKRCQLCGGKLVNNRCTLCGLDNTKSDKTYKLNKSSCDTQPLTHVHREQKHETSKEIKRETAEWKNTIPKHTAASRKSVDQMLNGKRKKGNTALVWVVVIVVFLSFAFNFIGMQVSTGDVLDDWFESDEEYMEDRYVSVTRELSEDGELYDMVLEAGTYIVGVHIPEGTYYIEEEQAETYGGFYLEDDENLIYFGESFDEDDEIEIIEDIRCYAGAKLSVRERARFVSENAQTGSMTGLANPLTEEVTVSDGFVAGTDFPAGTYDVVMQSGDTSFAYLVPGTIPENSDEEYEGVTERFWIDTSDGTFVKKNIYMPSGTKIMIDAGEVQLVPSEIIPESYEDYYFIY